MEDLKEYLRKNSNDTYSYIGTVRPEHVSDSMIEIPEGAQVYAVNNGYHYFFSSAGIGFEWSVLWQRPFHPEELPFIDDEPSINDQYAEIETVRQSAWQKQEGGSHDEISNPKHYTSGSIECIDAIEASMSHDAFCGFLKGNVQKYLWRYQYKGGLSSLNKAKWYIEKLIETEKCSKVQSLEG